MSINKVILVGNVGKDPDVRHLDSGASVANFSLATSESYTARNGEKVTTTEWHNIVCWRGLADIAEKYIKKGRQLYVEGKIRTRSWDDKDGNKRYTTEVVADVIQLLGSRGDTAPVDDPPTAAPERGGFNSPGFQSVESDDDVSGGDDDLPF